MAEGLENIDEIDPLAVPEKRAIIDKIIRDNKRIPGAPIVVLNELQSRIGYISFPMQEYAAKLLRVPPVQIYGLVSFYSFFTTKPRGKHTIKLCLGTACYVSGASKVVEEAKEVLGIDIGETTPDWQLSLECCRCVGACSQAPTAMIDNDVFGRMTPERLPEIIDKYRNSGEG